jgi:hypothetical protein
VTQKPVQNTDTDAFRRWFGESKVVDERGEPLVVYHGGFDVVRGRPPVFRKARRSGYGSGVYFTPQRERAESYAKEKGGVVGAYYLRIRNPFVLADYVGHQIVHALTTLGWDRKKAEKYVEREEERHGYVGAALEQAATARGHDGLFVYYRGTLSEIVVFDPRQIKSATDNVGTFDPYNPSVLAGPRRRG